MSNSNPYTRGNYFGIMACIMGFQGKPFTKSQVLEHCVTELGMSATSAEHSTSVVMSPREIPEDGAWPQGAGNFSAQGHLYFLNLINRKVVKDEEGNEVKEEQRFQLRWRKEFYHPFSRENLDLTQDEITTRNERRAARKAEKKANAAKRSGLTDEERAAKKIAKEKREVDAIIAKAERKVRKEKRDAEKVVLAAGVEARNVLRLDNKSDQLEADEAAEDARLTTREFKRLDRIALLEESKLATATGRLSLASETLEDAQATLAADSENEKLQDAVDSAQAKVDLWQERTDSATTDSVAARLLATDAQLLADNGTKARDAHQEFADITYAAYKDAKDAAKVAKDLAAALKADEKAARLLAAEMLAAEAAEAAETAEDATIEIDAETADEDGDRITEADATESDEVEETAADEAEESTEG